jgi:hypothetical protein
MAAWADPGAGGPRHHLLQTVHYLDGYLNGEQLQPRSSACRSTLRRIIDRASVVWDPKCFIPTALRLIELIAR